MQYLNEKDFTPFVSFLITVSITIRLPVLGVMPDQEYRISSFFLRFTNFARMGEICNIFILRQSFFFNEASYGV